MAVLLGGLTAWRKAGVVSPRQRAGGEGQGSGMNEWGRDLKTQEKAATSLCNRKPWESKFQKKEKHGELWMGRIWQGEGRVKKSA